jgi:predicted TIM-barrel fold metal-dependent hydrolase
MKLRVLCLALTVLPVGSAHGQSPRVDHHQHLFSAAISRLISATPLPPVELPPDLAALVQARNRAAREGPALAALYTEDAWLVPGSGPSWIRGREAVAAWWMASRYATSRLTPVGSGVAGTAGYIAAYLTDGEGESTRHAAHVLLSVRQDPQAGWVIAAEALTTPGPAAVDPIAASDLVSLLDAAGIQRAVVLSVAYMFGNPSRTVENEYDKVKAENDWTAEQAARFPDRLLAFCSFNPLREYALEELARCAKDKHLRRGLKLHFGNSVVDYGNGHDVEKVRRVFRAANDHGMAIVVHMRSSISRKLGYGRPQARVFLDELLPAAPDVPVQIAHLAGAGGNEDPPADEALAVFVEAIARRDPRTRRLYFDVTSAVDLNIPAERAKRVASRIRQLGLERVLYGSDAPAGGNLAPRQGWAAFRQLPLTEAEFRTIAGNVAPFLK